MSKYTKIIHLDINRKETVEEIQKNFKHHSANKVGGFSWWVRKHIQLFEDGQDLVQMANDLQRAYSACRRLSEFACQIYEQAYPDNIPIDAQVIYAKALNQRDIREWIE